MIVVDTSVWVTATRDSATRIATTLRALIDADTVVDRQFLRAEDFQEEQDYQLGRRRGVNAGMLRPGADG